VGKSSDSNKYSFSHFDSLLILSGVSGGGRSTALQCLSDMGFYALDNLPVGLFSSFIELTKSAPLKFSRTALTLDADFDNGARDLIPLLDSINDHNQVRILFFDCDTNVLLRRYSETRRPHPGFNSAVDSTLEDTVHRERALLELIRLRAHLILDTSDLTVHDLKREVRAFAEALTRSPKQTVRVNFVSFGFKFGAPRDCDLLVDVRFLPNPYFVEHLREKTGKDLEVAKYVLESPDCDEFITKYQSMLQFLLPRYVLEGKSYINIGIGCTGGKHRSVALAERFAANLSLPGISAAVKHRDIAK
jgi:UPF0042 nucleotide-binding protein